MTRGEELAQVLDLAAQLPAEHELLLGADDRRVARLLSLTGRG